MSSLLHQKSTKNNNSQEKKIASKVIGLIRYANSNVFERHLTSVEKTRKNRSIYFQLRNLGRNYTKYSNIIKFKA